MKATTTDFDEIFILVENINFCPIFYFAVFYSVSDKCEDISDFDDFSESSFSISSAGAMALSTTNLK